MTSSRMLVIVLIAAAVCMVSAGVGAASAAAWYVDDEKSEDITSFSEGNNVITDPEGDVPYSFIDLLQGSLDISQTSTPSIPNFVPYSEDPLLTSYTVVPNSIFKLSNDEYHMLFVEQRASGDYPADFNADLLISTDGLTWDTSSIHRNVISNQQSGHTFNYYVAVIKEGDVYKAWHSATSDWNIAGTELYYSTAPDGIQYSGHGKVLNNGPYPEYDSRNINHPVIVFDGTIYHLYYSAYPGHQSGPPDRSYHWTIAYATSSDGINWTKHGVVIDPGWSPMVVFDGTKFEMIYNVQSEGEPIVEYAVSHNGLNWETVGRVDSIDGTVVGLAKENGTYKVWYRRNAEAGGWELCYATTLINDTTPPTLTIASPAPDTTTHSPTITIAGTASDPSCIASVTANGALADGAADWSTWSSEVTLTEGENTITVVATNTTGGSRTKTIAITYTPILDGKVLSSSTNEGIPNATVTLVGTGKTAQTGTNGYYSFSDVADGSYTLTASKLGYIFSPVDVVVSETTRASPIIGTLDTTVINATITSTVMPSGLFEPGDSVEVTITAKNRGTIEHTFYIGYSVCDPDDTFWDAPYVPVTLGPGDIATETLRWTVQPGAPAGSYDIYTAAWATQHWSYLYDNLDREAEYEIFSVQPNLEHIPGWTFNNDERYDVLVDSEKYRAILTINDSNHYISWMIYDSDGKVPDLTTFQHAAKTATVAAMAGPDTTDEVAGLRRVQESMNEFTGWISLAKFALWARDAGAYLTGKLVLLASTGGTSLTTEIPASVVSHEIAVGLSEKILKDLTPGASNLKDIVSAYAIIKVQHSASKLGEAANALEEYDGGLWTYHEANRYYDNYKYGVIDGMTYMNLTSELQPGSDFVSQMCGVCNEVLKGATYGVIDFDALTVVELANSIEDLDAVKSSAIMGEKYRDRFAVTDARFGANAIELWDAYQTANKVSGSLMCPGNLHAYDSQGRHVGVNSTGGIDLEIPNSYYSGPDVEPEIISIYTPQDDNITFCVDNATTTGMFNLTLEKQMNMTMDTVCYLNIPITETTAVSISTNNSSNPDHIMEIDSDDDGVVDWIVNPNSTETNHKPVSRINPPSQIAFAEDYPVLITGNGIDVEDGELSEDALTWTSSVDGLIGSGSMLNTTNLSIGNHTIVLTVIDSNGAMSMDSIEIRIYMVTTGELIGDLNGDDAITPTDAAIALEIAAGSRPFDDAADVNDDGMVTSLDALMILQAAAGRIVL
jgi:hypothetical protein